MAIVMVNHLTLDGVVQGPGRPDEDRRDGFAYGGWGHSTDDAALRRAMGPVMGERFSWLFGRVSYEGMLSHWNEVGGPFKDGLNNATKYVATSHPDYEPPWPNTELVTGDVVARIRELREQVDGNLVMMGSAELFRSLLPHGLVDQLLLFVHPVVLGSGRRLFGAADAPVHFDLRESTATADGTLVLTYQRRA